MKEILSRLRAEYGPIDSLYDFLALLKQENSESSTALYVKDK